MSQECEHQWRFILCGPAAVLYTDNEDQHDWKTILTCHIICIRCQKSYVNPFDMRIDTDQNGAWILQNR